MYRQLFNIKVFVTAFFLLSFTYKQTMIPLNNEKGIPFYKDEMDYYVDGFEIDENNNFYFLGGEQAILVCFKGNELLFRKKYTEFKSNQIYKVNDKLYLFDYMYEKNNLFILNKTNGNVEKKYFNIVKNRVNSYLFRDTSLILEVFDSQKKIDMSTERGFTLYSLDGKYIKQVNNPYNLPKNLTPKSRTILYLGMWKNNFVFWEYDFDKKLYKVFLKNTEGKVIASQTIEESTFGKSFYGSPIEHKKLRNGNIYVLGHDQKSAIITELPLKILFSQI